MSHRDRAGSARPIGSSRWKRVGLLAVVMLLLTLTRTSLLLADDGGLRVAIFRADATPPLESPVAYALARKIEDRLSARGIVLLGAGDPIVLCAVDWIGIANDGHDAWRNELASAAGTTPDRVAVHTLHQHDAPACDFASEQLLTAHGAGGVSFDVVFARQTIERTASAVRSAISDVSAVSHLGLGHATVQQVASNRRILGPDGKVAIVRYSKSQDPAAIEAPEGVIDPVLRMLSFWNGDEPLVCLSYYATHPQSYYGQGDVTAEFVGLARAEREAELAGLPHIHFNGASGNVAAGKYNDGSPEARVRLTERMTEGLRAAWENTNKFPLDATDVEWRVERVQLPVSAALEAKTLQQQLSDPQTTSAVRFNAARSLVFMSRIDGGGPTELSCLRLGNAYVLHMPGELFVEYQLAAQDFRPDDFVCMAAYGDYGPGYIGTEISYAQGGYETQVSVSNVAPEVEALLMQAMRRLLK